VIDGPPAATPASAFVAAPGLLIHSWGESCDLVYLPSAGTTHRVAAATAELLRWLRDSGKAASQAEVATLLEGVFDPAQSAQLIDELVAIGLLWRATRPARIPEPSAA
jgi:hypothetical protein